MSETSDAAPGWPGSLPLLWVEFLALFVAAPVALAFLIGAAPPIALLMGFVVLALWLLARTPGFRMRELWRGPVLAEWPIVLGFTLLTTLVVAALALWLVPGRFLEIFRYRPELWLLIMAAYPLFSALPQEIIFRTLFFRRYARLFPHRHVALVINALVFGLAHLFFLHPVTLVLAVLGGAVFAWTYLRNGSTLLAVVLHSIAGQLIFTSGLGIYFYHGAVGG